MYANGFQGEFTDDFPDECHDVSVSIDRYIGRGNTGTYDVLVGLTPFETRLLKRCLADSVRAAPYLSFPFIIINIIIVVVINIIIIIIIFLII